MAIDWQKAGQTAMQYAPTVIGGVTKGLMGIAALKGASNIIQGQQPFPKLQAALPKIGAAVDNGIAGVKQGLGAVPGMIQKAGEALLVPGSTSVGQFADTNDALKTAQGGTELGGAVDTQLQDAIQGKLTAPGSEFYKNQSVILDQNASDAKKATLNDLSFNGQTGGGIEGRAMMDLNQRLGNDKNALMSNTQNQYALQAMGRAGQKDSNLVNLAKTAISGDAQEAGADLNTKQYLQNWVPTISNAASSWQNRRLKRLANQVPGWASNNTANY